MAGSAAMMRSAGIVARQAKRAQLEVLRRCGSDGECFVDYGWIKLLYTGDGDIQELYYHQHQRRWHEKDMNVFRSLLAPGQTVIDVGANLGFLSAMFASLVGPSGRVLAFEPSLDTFRKLEKTIAINDLAQVVPLNLGCGAVSHTPRLNKVSRNSGNSSIVGSGTESVEIRIEPLDEIEEAWERPAALLKIDTEGYEPEVLRGAKRLIAECRPTIYLEMGGEYADSTRRTIGLLDEAGYNIDHVRDIDWSRVGNGSDYFFFPLERHPPC